MPEYVHTQQRADAAHQEGAGYQRGFACALFVFTGFVLSFIYNTAGYYFFERHMKTLFSLIFGACLMLATNSLRKLLRIPDNFKLFCVFMAANMVIHYFRWTFHFTWLRSYDFVVGGLHPIFQFLGFMNYFWYVVTEGILPGFYFMFDLFRFNNIGWVFTFYDFELHLHGWLLMLVWLGELVIISGIGVVGVFLNKELYLDTWHTWARYKLLPYPFENFTPAEMERIESGKVDVILEKTIAAGNSFSQIAVCYAGKNKTEYIAVINARMNRKEKVVYARPKKVVVVGAERIEEMEAALKISHGEFFEDKKETAPNPGIEIIKEITKNAEIEIISKVK